MIKLGKSSILRKKIGPDPGIPRAIRQFYETAGQRYCKSITPAMVVYAKIKDIPHRIHPDKHHAGRLPLWKSNAEHHNGIPGYLNSAKTGSRAVRFSGLRVLSGCGAAVSGAVVTAGGASTIDRWARLGWGRTHFLRMSWS